MFKVAEYQAEGYKIKTDLYSGPLDLLLDLIDRSELDITRLALAQVTDQYLAYMHNLADRNAAEVSAFLVIAARLVQIKSAALLPRPLSTNSTSHDEVDDGEALARQLILYRRFKQMAHWFEERQAAGYHTYLRLALPSIKINQKLDLDELDLNDLIKIARQVLLNPEQFAALSQDMVSTRMTIREKIHLILTTLRLDGSSSFLSILGDHSRLDIVVTFLAMLELIKLSSIEVHQNDLFGEIVLHPLGEWDESADIEADFKE
jgi:segregation and condensation protein A